MKRFRGKLGGRKGTFVLQGQEIVENGNITATRGSTSWACGELGEQHA